MLLMGMIGVLCFVLLVIEFEDGEIGSFSIQKKRFFRGACRLGILLVIYEIF